MISQPIKIAYEKLLRYLTVSFFDNVIELIGLTVQGLLLLTFFPVDQVNVKTDVESIRFFFQVIIACQTVCITDLISAKQN